MVPYPTPLCRCWPTCNCTSTTQTFTITATNCNTTGCVGNNWYFYPDQTWGVTYGINPPQHIAERRWRWFDVFRIWPEAATLALVARAVSRAFRVQQRGPTVHMAAREKRKRRLQLARMCA
jgi:hypothetical protein